MPTGGTSLNQREAGAFDERTRASTLVLCPVMLGIARPELLPESPFGQFLREDAASIKRKRDQAYAKDIPKPVAAPPKPVLPLKQPKPPKATKPTRQDRRDHTVYLFILPEGEEIECTRRELSHRLPGLNPGSLADLVRGVIRQAKGVRCLGPVKGNKRLTA